MAKSGPIILIEDDPDDKEMLEHMLAELKVAQELKWFATCREALPYIRNTQDKPLLILCDVNLPGENGLRFKKDMDQDPVIRQKSIPFIFYSTAADQETVNTAYTEMTVQGFFRKESDYEQNKANIASIIDYWQRCKHPNTT
jgi:CheY-like chemotaxis protein